LALTIPGTLLAISMEDAKPMTSGDEMKTKTLFAALSFTMALTGCIKGEQGPAGPPGSPGVTGQSSGSKVVSTINCSGTISGLSGNAGASLNGLGVDYNAILTTSGDVYASAAVINPRGQDSGTEFYAANQIGANTGAVYIVADHDYTADWGQWKISLDRKTLITSAIYTDPSLGAQSPVNLTFTANACVVQDW
jgi:hypothetical protein